MKTRPTFCFLVLVLLASASWAHNPVRTRDAPKHPPLPGYEANGLACFEEAKLLTEATTTLTAALIHLPIKGWPFGKAVEWLDRRGVDWRNVLSTDEQREAGEEWIRVMRAAEQSQYTAPDAYTPESYGVPGLRDLGGGP